MLIYAFQVPAVLLGKANIAEGLARVQMEAFQRRIQSIQAELEKIIEQQIFQRVLQANGLKVDVEFEWGRPSKMEVTQRLSTMTEIMKIPTTSMTMTGLLEKEMVKLLNLPEEEYEKKFAEEEVEKRSLRKKKEIEKRKEDNQ